MKRIVSIFFFIFFLNYLLNGQITGYTFSQSTDTYIEISDGTTLGDVNNDEQVFNAIPIGFNFNYNGTIYDVVSISVNGFIAMGSTVSTSNVAISSGASNNVIVALNRDLKSRTDGSLSSQLLGTAPYRVFTIQWHNYKRTPTSTANDTLNFQIKLYETTNKITFNYGHCYAANFVVAGTVQCGLRGSSNTDFNNRTNTTSWTTTTAGTYNSASCKMNSTIVPPAGLVFSWEPYQPGLPPLYAQNISPLDNSTQILLNSSLIWQSGGGYPTGYRVYFGTDNPPTNIKNGYNLGNIISYDPSPDLTLNTTYYWKIIPFNLIGEASDCPVWSFTTYNQPPTTPPILAPMQNTTQVSLTPLFAWISSNGYPSGYRIYLGTNNPPNNVLNGLDLGNVTSYTMTTALNPSTTYYWQLVPYNQFGNTVNCPVRSFSTETKPNPAIIVSPLNSASNVSVTSSLQWNSGGGYSSDYKVYFGTNNPPTNIVNGVTQSSTTYVLGTLLKGVTYYWKIVPFNQYGDAVNCPVWNFTTYTQPSSQDWPWAKQAGGTNEDRVYKISTDHNGNNLIIGTFSNTASFGTTTITSRGSDDIFIAKLDANGNWLWAKRAGGTGLDRGIGISCDLNGNCYITGWFVNNSDFGSTSLSSRGSYDVFVAKLDSNGNWLWANRAGGTSADDGDGVSTDSSGNCYLTGSFCNTADFGTTSLTSFGSYDIFVAKLDSNGNWLWVKRGGGLSLDSLTSSSTDNSGNSYIIGWFEGVAGFDSISLTSNGDDDLFIAKIDTNGNWLWAKRAGGVNNDIGYAISIDVSGNSYITGRFKDNSDFGSTSFISNGDFDIFIAKLDTYGNWLWATQAGGTDWDQGLGISTDNNGNCYVVGMFSGSVGFGTSTLSSSGTSDYFITKLDTNGNWQYAKSYEGSIEDISTDSNESCYLTGFFYGTVNFGTTILNSSGSGDVFVAKLGNTINYTISGYVYDFQNSGIDSAIISVTGMTPIQIFNNGYYQIAVPSGWSGTLTASKAGWTFNPVSRTYQNVTSNLTNQNFIGTPSLSNTVTLLLPANNSTGLAYSGQTLSWTPGAGNTPTGYKVYLSATSPPTTLVSTQAGTSYSTGVLLPDKTYYWKVVPYNASGDGPVSEVWNFTTLCSQSLYCILGTVKDQTGAVIPDVNVSITGMNYQYNTVTNSSGQFSKHSLNISQVNVYLSKQNYNPVSQTFALHHGLNTLNMIMNAISVSLDSLVLSDSLTIYADNIEEYQSDKYYLTGNVNINGILLLPGQVIVDKRANLVHPQIIVRGDVRGININGQSPIIIPASPLSVVYKVIDEALVPYNYDYFVLSGEEVCGYDLEIGKLTIKKNQALSKYVEVMGLIKKKDESFFSKIMDKDNWINEAQSPDLFMVELEKISVSVYYAQHTGISYGCDISGISCNFATFSIKDFSLWIDPTEDIFGGSLKLKIPGVGNLSSYVNPSRDDMSLPVEIQDSSTGQTYQTNLERVLEMQRQGVFKYLEIEALLEFAHGHLNSLSMTMSGMNIPLFNSGTFIREIHGGVYDMVVNDMKIEATVDIGLHSSLDVGSLGPVVYLNDLGVEIKPWNYLQGAGEYQIFKNPVADGKFYYDAKKEALGLEGNVMMLTEEDDPGSAIIDGKVKGSISGSSFNAGLNAQLKTPDDLPFLLSWAEGLRFASVDANIHNLELSSMAQLYGLSLASKIVFGKPSFPWFHFYIGRNYEHTHQVWRGTRDGRQTIDFLVPENAEQIFIVAGNNLNLFNFTCYSPNGTVYDSLSSGYRQFTSSNQTILVIDYPQPGQWVFSTGQSGDITTEFNVLNQAPSALVSMPATRGSRDNNIHISMTDYSDTLNVEVYYDTDNKNFDGVLIQEFNAVNNADLDFVWHNSNIENGEYYIYTRIDDGKNTPVLQYAPGSIVVNNYFVEVPRNVSASTFIDSIYVSWDNPLGSDIILTEILLKDRYKDKQYLYSVVGDNHYSITDVPKGREYEVSCRFGNTEYKMSDNSSGVTIVYTNGMRNNAPYFTMNPDSVWTFVINQTSSYPLTASDPDGGNISFSLPISESGMNITGNSFNWNPSSNQTGFYQQPIIVSDGTSQDTLYQQIAVYSEEQAQLKVRFSSFNLYEADRMYVKINNLFSDAYYQEVTLTNLRSNAQEVVQCRRVNKFEYIGQFTISEYHRTEIPVQDGDSIQASYTYNGMTYTAISIYSSDPQLSDNVAPSAVSDLQTSVLDNGSVNLSWTATGDDGNNGRAYKYDIRYSYSPIIDNDDYLVSSLYSSSIYPSEAGALDTLNITLMELENISQHDSVFFAIVVEDANQNRSNVSNYVSASYLASPSNVTAVMVNDALFSVTWTDMFPGRSSATNRTSSKHVPSRAQVSFIGYSLLREHNGTLSTIADSLTESTYIDTINTLLDGTLRYGIKAIYLNGYSETRFTDTIQLDRLTDVRIFCQQDSLHPASGVNYIITGQDSLYQLSFSGQTNLSGVILLDNIYKSTYHIELQKETFFPAEYDVNFSNLNSEAVLDIFSVVPTDSINTIIQGNGILLFWHPVSGAKYYKIYASENPFVQDWGEPISIQNETYISLPSEDHIFYRVIAGAVLE